MVYQYLGCLLLTEHLVLDLDDSLLVVVVDPKDCLDLLVPHMRESLDGVVELLVLCQVVVITLVVAVAVH